MLTNKVESKNFVQLDIEHWIPNESELNQLDLKEFLFKEMILKEADFREMVENKDWSIYADKFTLVFVSNHAIIPQWAYLIIANKLQEVNSICYLKSDSYQEALLLHIIQNRDYSELENKRVFVKGCSRVKLSQQPYVTLAQKLSPIVRSLAFGESCSSVPIFKN